MVCMASPRIASGGSCAKLLLGLVESLLLYHCSTRTLSVCAAVSAHLLLQWPQLLIHLWHRHSLHVLQALCAAWKQAQQQL